MPAEPSPRTRHYGDFYGLSEPELAGRVALVVGNCQAESLRIMLAGPDITAIRTPPVHELTVDDMPHLERWLARADVLVSQPVRDDYHGLPLGIRQLASRLGSSSTTPSSAPAASAQTVPFPVIRFAGLYPQHAIIRPPRDASIVPPVVEYHDLSVLAEAAGAPLPALRPAAVRAVADHSRQELRQREAAHDTVVASDLFDAPSFEMMRTLNHPGNSVFREVARRVRERLGLDAGSPFDPGRPLLNGVHAPRATAVIEAFGMDAEETDEWIVGDARVPVADVRRAHLDWYAANPDIVAAGLARHEATLRLLATL